MDLDTEVHTANAIEIEKMMRVLTAVADGHDDVTPLEMTDIFMMLGVPDDHPSLEADLVAEVRRLALYDRDGNLIKKPRHK